MTFEELLAEFVFEVFDLVADSGCRDIQLVGRIAKALLLGGNTKRAQAAQGQVSVC